MDFVEAENVPESFSTSTIFGSPSPNLLESESWSRLVKAFNARRKISLGCPPVVRSGHANGFSRVACVLGLARCLYDGQLPPSTNILFRGSP